MIDNQTEIKDDEQERTKLANHIAQIIATKRQERGISIAITAGWGYGKTYFLDEYLTSAIKNNIDKDKINIVRVNAHELDYAQDPFLMLGSKISGNNKKEKAIIRNIGNIVLKQSKKVINEVNPALGSFINLVNALTTVDLNAFEKMEKEIEKLKKELEGGNKQKVIIVDELDRCKPEFADALLEAVKHFFNTPNISFILALNLDEANFLNGKRQRIYYEKFFDYTFDLPKLSYQFFINQKIGKVAGSLDWLKGNDYIDDISLFCKEALFNISLRHLDKILTQMSLMKIDDLKEFDMNGIDLIKEEYEQKELTRIAIELEKLNMPSTFDNTMYNHKENNAKYNSLVRAQSIHEKKIKSLFNTKFKASLNKVNSKLLFVLLCLFKHSMHYNTLQGSQQKTSPLLDMYKYLKIIDLSNNVYAKASSLKTLLSGYDTSTQLDDRMKIEPYYDSIVSFASFV